MNILYYIPGVGQEMGGIRQYSVALLKILAADHENNYYVYHDRNDTEILDIINNNIRLTLVTSPVADRWSVYYNSLSRKISGFYSLFTGKKIGCRFFDNICIKYKIDIVHSPYQFLPESKNAKSICTMHDVQELHFPEYFTPEDRAERAVGYLKYIKQADKIIVSYLHIKDDLVRYFNTDPEKVIICLIDMGNLWLDKFNADQVGSLEHLHISKKFILYPANTWEHKNHKKLLEAMVLLKRQGRSDIKLVCTGHKTAYFESFLKPFIEAEGLTAHAFFTGILNEADLYSVYQSCAGVVVPTLYEAGSFPLMESILLNIPVVCSSVTSLPETMGDAKFIFDPNNPLEISDMLIKLWDDKTFRDESIANCKEQAPKLRKTRTLEIVKGVYNSLKPAN